MSNAHISAMTKRLCGHLDMYSFSSKGRSGRNSDIVYANATVCGECRARVGRLVKNPGAGFYPVALPALVGRDGAVRWAKDLRLKALRMLVHVMAQLKKSQDPLATAVLAVYGVWGAMEPKTNVSPTNAFRCLLPRRPSRQNSCACRPPG